jgi:hypothetical protein
MIVMREILNVKQTQVHPGDPSYGWKWKAFLDDLSPKYRKARGAIDSRLQIRLEQLERTAWGAAFPPDAGPSPHRAGLVWGFENV